MDEVMGTFEHFDLEIVSLVLHLDMLGVFSSHDGAITYGLP